MTRDRDALEVAREVLCDCETFAQTGEHWWACLVNAADGDVLKRVAARLVSSAALAALARREEPASVPDASEAPQWFYGPARLHTRTHWPEYIAGPSDDGGVRINPVIWTNDREAIRRIVQHFNAARVQHKAPPRDAEEPR